MASYSQFSIQDRPKLKRYILMKLGGGLISLPLTDEQLEFCIDEALEEFSKWVHYDLDYFVLDVKKCYFNYKKIILMALIVLNEDLNFLMRLLLYQIFMKPIISGFKVMVQWQTLYSLIQVCILLLDV